MNLRQIKNITLSKNNWMPNIQFHPKQTEQLFVINRFLKRNSLCMAVSTF